METKLNKNSTQQQPAPSTAVAVNKDEKNGLSVIDLSGNIPDLSDATVAPFDLMSDYWTPENKGENKRVYFDRLATRQVLDQQTGELIDLDCAFFFEKVDGEVRTISNGSKRLVGLIQSMEIKRGTPLLITYKGKKPTRNGFKCDDWKVNPLMFNVG